MWVISVYAGPCGEEVEKGGVSEFKLMGGRRGPG